MEITEVYAQFVKEKLSDPSSNFDDLIERLKELNENGMPISHLLTAPVGICAEGGEFMEIIKKIVFQGKEWNEHNRFHITRELSDIMFYIQVACNGLGISIDDIIQTNIDKLNGRFKEGFTVQESENRKQGDL